MPPSPGRALPLSQHRSVCLPEATLYFLQILGPGGVISVLSGASSSEPPHLQHEEPGTQAYTEEAIPTVFQKQLATALLLQWEKVTHTQKKP